MPDVKHGSGRSAAMSVGQTIIKGYCYDHQS